MIPSQLARPYTRFVKIEKNSKRPVEQNWQSTANYAHDDPALQEWMKRGGNVGFLTSSRGIIAIDCDTLEAEKRILELLPPSFTIKSATKGLSHVYLDTDEPFNAKIKDEQGNTLVDVQGPGKQILIPPSRINDQPYTISRKIEIMHVSSHELKSLLNKAFGKQIQKNKKNEPRPLIYESRLIRRVKEKIKISDLLIPLGIDVHKPRTQCPFHPSQSGACLAIDHEKQIWHCFNCQRGGDVITLYKYIRGELK